MQWIANQNTSLSYVISIPFTFCENKNVFFNSSNLTLVFEAASWALLESSKSIICSHMASWALAWRGIYTGFLKQEVAKWRPPYLTLPLKDKQAVFSEKREYKEARPQVRKAMVENGGLARVDCKRVDRLMTLLSKASYTIGFHHWFVSRCWSWIGPANHNKYLEHLRVSPDHSSSGSACLSWTKKQSMS